MNEEEIIRNKMNRINENSTYGLPKEDEDKIVKVSRDLAIIWGIDSREIEQIMHDIMKRWSDSDYYRINCQKPPVYIGPVKVKSLKERLNEAYYQKEGMKMKPTSTQEIKEVKDMSFEFVSCPIERNSKLTVTATTDDDIYEFVFEGEHLIQICERAGLFTGWEKDQKIRELEKDKEKLEREYEKKLEDIQRKYEKSLKEKQGMKEEYEKKIDFLQNQYSKTIDKVVEYEENAKELERDSMLNKETADYWSKAYYELSNKYDKLLNANENWKKEYNKLNESLNNSQTKRNEWYEKYVKMKGEFDLLQRKYNLEKCANEAQHKFFRQYAGNGVEIDFNYAIDDVYETSYVIVDKKEYQSLLDNYSAEIHGEVEEFVEEPSSRRDILRCAEKCVCGQREQDYGSPESNFQLIADLWNDYLKKERSSIVVDATDVAMMMALLKIARIRNGGGSGDSFVDLAGYAACGGEIWAEEKKQKDQN